MKHIATLVKRVRALADQYPDAVYQSKGASCSYLAGTVEGGPDTPGCIVGQAAHGYIRKDYLAQADIQGDNVGGLIRYINAVNPHYLDTPRQVSDSDQIWLQVVQSRQDSGDSWGDAIRWADKAVADRDYIT